MNHVNNAQRINHTNRVNNYARAKHVDQNDPKYADNVNYIGHTLHAYLFDHTDDVNHVNFVDHHDYVKIVRFHPYVLILPRKD